MKVSLEVQDALGVLARIADKFDDNALDDDARKHWGKNDEYTNNRDPAKIELYHGRGGKCLLTLKDCLDARRAYHSTFED